MSARSQSAPRLNDGRVQTLQGLFEAKLFMPHLSPTLPILACWYWQRRSNATDPGSTLTGRSGCQLLLYGTQTIRLNCEAAFLSGRGGGPLLQGVCLIGRTADADLRDTIDDVDGGRMGTGRCHVRSVGSLVVRTGRTRLEGSHEQAESNHQCNEPATEMCNRLPFFSQPEYVATQAPVRRAKIYDFDLILFPGILFVLIAHMFFAFRDSSPVLPCKSITTSLKKCNALLI